MGHGGNQNNNGCMGEFKGQSKSRIKGNEDGVVLTGVLKENNLEWILDLGC